mgnify:CR=1 FL=1
MKPLLLAVAIATVPMTPLAAAEEATPRESQPYDGPKWEYRIETFLAGSVDGIPGMVAKVALSGPDAKRLEDLGKDGWELVSVTGGRAYFKRPIKEPPKRGWWPFW